MFIKVVKRASVKGTSEKTRPGISVRSVLQVDYGSVSEKIGPKRKGPGFKHLLPACSAVVPIKQPQKCQQCVRFHFPEFLCQHLSGR